MRQTIPTYIDNFQLLQKKCRWKMNKKTKMIIASIYAMNRQHFHINHFIGIADTIKKEAGFFSPLKGETRYMIAATLDVNFAEPIDAVSLLFKSYKDLIQAKFKRGSYTYIAAAILLTGHNEEENKMAWISQAKQMYDQMQKGHRFLTSHEDYPLAVLLASKDNKEVMERAKTFYQLLNKNGFRKGNNLQCTSHILALEKEHDVDTLIHQVIHVFDAFRRVRFKQKPMYYPIMGMLALLPPESFQIEDIVKTYKSLKKVKDFKWEKDLNIILAASFFMKEELSISALTETTLFTTLEAILQVQQAVMISTVAAATISSSGASD